MVSCEDEWEAVYGKDGDGESQPERSLLLRVFETALEDYIRGPGGTRASYLIWASAKDWIVAENMGGIMSFDFICSHVLKTDPQAVRKAVMGNEWPEEWMYHFRQR